MSLQPYSRSVSNCLCCCCWCNLGNVVISAIFEVGSIAIFCMFYGYWTGLMLGPLTIVFFVVTRGLGFDITNGVILSLTNLSVVMSLSISQPQKCHIFISGLHRTHIFQPGGFRLQIQVHSHQLRPLPCHFLHWLGYLFSKVYFPP